MLQAASTPFTFYTLFQWQKQAEKFVNDTNGKKVIILDQAELSLQLKEQASTHNKQRFNGKPITGGAGVRSVTSTDPEIFIKKVLLTARAAVEPSDPPDNFLRSAVNLTSTDKIEDFNYSQLNSLSFLKTTSPMLDSDTGIWQRMRDEINILRSSSSYPHKKTDKEHLDSIKNATKKLLYLTDSDLTDLTKEERKPIATDRIKLFRERCHELFPDFQTDASNKKLAKAQEKKDNETISQIYDVINKCIAPIENDPDTDFIPLKPAPSAHKGKTKKTEKKPPPLMEQSLHA